MMIFPQNKTTRNVIILIAIISSFFPSKTIGQSVFKNIHFGIHGEHSIINSNQYYMGEVINSNIVSVDILVGIKSFVTEFGVATTLDNSLGNSWSVVKLGMGKIFNSGRKTQFPILGIFNTIISGESEDGIEDFSGGIEVRVLHYLTNNLALSSGGSTSYSAGGDIYYSIRLGINYSIIREDK